ncbi:hypothetical protein [Qipengyuania sp.]|uniref:hypothetical protein n=1 Tax=Qipengyuania sp. TaxID=2004515 RepID=UPI0035C82555
MPFLFSTGSLARDGLRTATPRRTEQAPVFEALFMQSFVEMRAREGARNRKAPEAISS